MRLTLVIWSLSAGGAQRVLSLMANHWAERGREVTLLTFDGSDPPFFDLHPAVRHRPLDLARSSGSIRGAVKLRILRRAIRESAPRAVVSFLDKINVMVLLATRGLGLPVVVSERVSPAHHAIGGKWRVLRRWTYPWATRLVVQHRDVLRCFAAPVRRKARVVPNPVPAPPAARAAPRERRPNTTVTAMGRLAPQKGFDALLRAFADVAPECPEWSLVIWGEGRLRGELERLRDELGLRGRAFLPGRTPEPFRKMRQADLFVLSSRYEGFPNVLCEAMACGLPVVSVDCPVGPARIVRDGIDGLLAPPGDPRALADAMRRLMRDAPARRRLAARAPEVVERFSPEKVMRAWDGVLREALRAQGAFPRP